LFFLHSANYGHHQGDHAKREVVINEVLH